MSNDRVKVYRVEVLGDNVQKYSSTTVQGGGGYVTTVNGTTFGQTDRITSTVSHHVDQDIWVKDLKSGREFQINLKDAAFPVRPGHVLRVVFDSDSKQWERLCNETTGQIGYGEGVLNPNNAKQIKMPKYVAYLLAFGLSIPLLNWLVGIVGIVMLILAPAKVCDNRLPGANLVRLLTFFSGCGLFVFGTFGFLVFIVEPAQWGIFTKSLVLIAYGGVFYGFLKYFPLPWYLASEYIERRSNYLDSILKNEIEPVAAAAGS